ncbi:MAG: phosphoribosyl-ATP pyrophosphohydrolase [Asticcacaulis sp.]|nr:phosphoribosyl-ATP pyrophosphohydrolase [Asticcacaulis sp.]
MSHSQKPLSDLDAFSDRLKAISDRYGRVYDVDRGGDGRSRRNADTARHDVAMEMADVLCMLILMARAEGIDLNAAIAEKWLKWETVIAEENAA